MKRVLFVGHFAGRTGAPMVLLHLLRWLRQNTGLEFEVLLRQGGPPEAEYATVAPTWVLPSQYANAALSSRVRAAANRVAGEVQLRRIANKPWDLIYSNTITNGKEVAVLSAGKIPVITHVHELGYWIERSGRKNLALVKQQTGHYLAASSAVKSNLVEEHKIPEDEITVVPEFIAIPNARPQSDPLRIRGELGVPAGAFLLGGSGGEFWRKGRDLIPQLLQAIEARAPQAGVHFVWVGQPGNAEEEQNLKHDLEKVGLASRFHLVGEVTNPSEYFDALDAFVLLSRDDPFPLVCLEAALLAKPIGCFADAGGIPEIVGEDAGFVVPYLDLAAMAEKLVSLFASPALRRTLGENARNKVQEKCAVDVAAPAVLEIMEKVATTSISLLT
jgi:glycosyltransferase involved in cell wall biosynthesis